MQYNSLPDFIYTFWNLSHVITFISFFQPEPFKDEDDELEPPAENGDVESGDDKPEVPNKKQSPVKRPAPVDVQQPQKKKNKPDVEQK